LVQENFDWFDVKKKLALHLWNTTQRWRQSQDRFIFPQWNKPFHVYIVGNYSSSSKSMVPQRILKKVSSSDRFPQVSDWGSSFTLSLSSRKLWGLNAFFFAL
jgi:hypothetical protein